MTDLNIRYGFIGGFLSFFFLSVMYVINKELLIGNARLAVWLLVVGVMFLGVNRERSLIAEEYPFKWALRSAFLIFIVAQGILLIYDYIMFNFYDPSLPLLYKQYELSELMKMKGTVSDYQWNEMHHAWETSDYKPTLGNVFFQFFVNNLYGFTVAFVVALIMRKGGIVSSKYSSMDEALKNRPVK
jgi:hypothetical protein